MRAIILPDPTTFSCAAGEETMVAAITRWLGAVAERAEPWGRRSNRSLSTSHTRGSWGLLSMGSVILTCCALGTLRMFSKHYCQNPTTPGLSSLTEGCVLASGESMGHASMCACARSQPRVFFTGAIHLAFLSFSVLFLFLFVPGRVSLGPGSYQSG